MGVFSDLLVCFFKLFLVRKGYGSVLGMGKNVWDLRLCFFNMIINLKKYISKNCAFVLIDLIK